jgi:hypothetical protein
MLFLPREWLKACVLFVAANVRVEAAAAASPNFFSFIAASALVCSLSRWQEGRIKPTQVINMHGLESSGGREKGMSAPDTSTFKSQQRRCTKLGIELLREVAESEGIKRFPSFSWNRNYSVN